MGKTASDDEDKITPAVLREVLRHNPAVVYIAEPDGQFDGLYIAPGVRDMLGYPPERFTDEPGFYAAGIHPDDRERVFAALGDLKRTGSRVIEYRFRHADGAYRWVRDQLRQVRGPEGKPFKLVGYWVDITAEHQAQESLVESEARLRTVLDTVLDGVIVVDANGRIESFNPAAERLFGYRAPEVIGRDVSVLLPDPIRRDHDGRHPHYLTRRDPRSPGIGREVLGRRKDGRELHLYLGYAETEMRGRTVFIGAVCDITARREAEAALAESHKHALAILNGSRVGAVVVDARDKVVFLNDAARRICERPGEQGLGEDWFACMPFDAESVARIQGMARRPTAEREKVGVRFTPLGRAEAWLEVEVRDDPRAHRGKIFLIDDVTELHMAREVLGQAAAFEGMMGQSAAMRAVFQQIRDVAKGDWTALIEGETGTGKELAARAIHQLGPRKGRPFVAVNAAGLTESLLASQLFGHKRGAFTGAVADNQGYFEAAEGGTLFLDEIGDIPPGVQANLLRVLQEWEITRLGETQPRPVNVRVIAATHRDLAADVTAGRFRADLFYRLRVARILLPPLRARLEDVPLLVGATLARLRVSTGKPVDGVDVDALRRLTEYTWPGNVRELISAINFAVIRARGHEIQTADLPPEIAGKAPDAHATWNGVDRRTGERERVLDALVQAGGSRTAAARLLGISRATLYRRLGALGIPPRDRRAPVSAETHPGGKKHFEASH